MILFANLMLKNVEHKPEESYVRKDGRPGKTREHWVIECEIERRKYRELKKEWRKVKEIDDIYSVVKPPVSQGPVTALIEATLGGYENNKKVVYRVIEYVESPAVRQTRGQKNE